MKLRYIAPKIKIECMNYGQILADTDTEVGVSGEMDLSLTYEDGE